ncbi:unnamed protein product [Penicillium manginii]
MTPCPKCEKVEGKTKCACGAGPFCEPCYNKSHLVVHPDHKKASWRTKWMRGLSDTLTLSFGEKYFLRDEHTKWFGYNVEELENGGEVGAIIETMRFQDLVERARMASSRGVLFPSVVAFIGETGAGKSTIIRGLMAGVGLSETELNELDAPAPGMDGDHKPTTGEVNLYHDPKSFNSEKPIFYADSEGIGGSTPISVKYQTMWNHDPLYRRHNMEEQAMDRMRATQSLYPKFLYIFSDVVCMVTNNRRSLADVAEKLLRWSQVGATGAINQYLLPSLIIILNSLPNERPEYMGDTDKATLDFFDLLDPEVQKNTTFKRLAEKVSCDQIPSDRLSAKIVQVSAIPLDKVTMRDILKMFFSNVHVHYIPMEAAGLLGSAFHVQEQTEKLQEKIAAEVKKLQVLRQEKGASLDSSQMSIVFRSAFVHLAAGKEGTFDFSLCRRHISLPLSTKDFIGIFLHVSLKERIGSNFQYAASVIASSLILEVLKSDGPGTADSIIPEDALSICRQAIEDFLDNSLECDYREPTTHERCKNTRLGHANGHQGKDGTILAGGTFQNNRFSSDRFLQAISSEIKTRLQSIRHKVRVERRTFAIAERKALLRSAPDNTFWTDTQKTNNGAKRTAMEVPCFACLFRKPEYILPCDHSLCHECVSLFDESDHKYPTVSIIERCPFCPRPLASQHSSMSHQEIAIFPKLAGVRILSLDGGGVRGIVELETLRRLEWHIGLDLPIGNFFDLIVGTSAGGLIALAIGPKARTIDTCINDWNNLCKSCFKEKLGAKIPLIGYLMSWARESMYHTESISDALQQYFGANHTLFGLRSSSEGDVWRTTTRVAVTTSVDEKLRLFANYNLGDGKTYMRSRTEIWKTDLDGANCYDGGLIQNNPVQTALNESKRIWGTNAPVDLILSIGSGIGTPTKPSKQNATLSEPWITKLFKTFYESMNGDALWQNFWEGNHAHHERARRLNVRFQRKQEYELDDVPNIQTMLTEAQSYTFRPDDKCLGFQEDVHPTQPLNSLSEIATRLRASLFFFQLDSIAQTKSKDAAYIIGAIYCRLDPRTTSYAKLASMVACFRRGDSILWGQNATTAHLNHAHDPDNDNTPVEQGQSEANMPQGPLVLDDRLRRNMTDGPTTGTRLKYPVAFTWVPTKANSKLDLRVQFTDRSIASISGFPVALEVRILVFAPRLLAL